MRIPFEHDTPADPIEPTDQAAADIGTSMPTEDPPANDLANAGPADPPITNRPDDAVAPSVTPLSTPAVASDAGAVQRRITMQLYSRMVIDLKVLTGDKRLPTDAEIDEALNRATRALGVWRPARHDAVWRTPADEARPAPHFASFDPAHRFPVLTNSYGKESPSFASSGSPVHELGRVPRR